MKRSRIGMLLVGLTALALSAGVVTGMLAAKLPTSSTTAHLPPPPKPGPSENYLVQELGLTTDQTAGMRSIWEGMRGKVHDTFQQAESLQQDRDKAIVDLLSDDQKAKFEKISLDFAGRYDELGQQRDRMFKEAVEETKKLLTGSQKQKYDEILKKYVNTPTGSPSGTKVFSSPGATKPARDAQ